MKKHSIKGRTNPSAIIHDDIIKPKNTAGTVVTPSLTILH